MKTMDQLGKTIRLHDDGTVTVTDHLATGDRTTRSDYWEWQRSRVGDAAVVAALEKLGWR